MNSMNINPNQKPDYREALIDAALRAAAEKGLRLVRKPGRGRSATYESNDGETYSLRTSQDRHFAFPPLDEGKRWKTLSDVDWVLLAATDRREDPEKIEVYLFPASEALKRFDANRKARIAAGQRVPDNYGNWIPMDDSAPDGASSVGKGIVKMYPAIAVYPILEFLEFADGGEFEDDAGSDISESRGSPGPPKHSVGDILKSAREDLAAAAGVPVSWVTLDLRIETR